jgi:hypothetical protein
MAELPEHPRLKPLHAYSSLNAGKLATLDRCSSELLLTSLCEGPNRLKTREDGTILEGHHRIYILRQRGVDVDKLPREIVVKETE